MTGRGGGWPFSVALFALLFLAVWGTHGPLLHLPYFWDEAGYYVPAARDLLTTGTLIPFSTPSNAHPPLVMAYLALAWKVAGFAPFVTRSAMLGLAAFSLLGLYRLAETVANRSVALATVFLTALWPVFFVQSSLAQVDMAAAGFTFWGLAAYVRKRGVGTAVWFSLAALSKETAILGPLGLLAWELAQQLGKAWTPEEKPEKAMLAALAFPVLPLAAWFAYHYWRTGFVFGNPEFFRYNVQATAHPLRIVLAFAMRIWQTFGYMHLYVLTLAAGLALWLPARWEYGKERPRIAVKTQVAFLTVLATYLGAMAVIGGAVLARYMLPVAPLGMLLAISALWRRVRRWKAIVVLAGLSFVLALFTRPPLGFTLEDNLAYRDFIEMHQHAAKLIETRYPTARVLTAWPGNDELSTPYLGYVTRPVGTLGIEHFALDQIMDAAQARGQFDVAFVFSTKFQPRYTWMDDWPAWRELKTRYFGYHRDLPPEAVARILGGTIVWEEQREGQWAAVVVMEQAAVEARSGVRFVARSR